MTPADEPLAAALTHTQSLLYGGGPALTNSSGVPWNAAYVDSRGDPTCDLRSNIAAESRAKVVYERLINISEVEALSVRGGFVPLQLAHVLQDLVETYRPDFEESGRWLFE